MSKRRVRTGGSGFISEYFATIEGTLEIHGDIKLAADSKLASSAVGSAITLAETVDMRRNRVIEVPGPVDDNDAISKGYVDLTVANIPNNLTVDQQALMTNLQNILNTENLKSLSEDILSKALIIEADSEMLLLREDMLRYVQQQSVLAYNNSRSDLRSTLITIDQLGTDIYPYIGLMQTLYLDEVMLQSNILTNLEAGIAISKNYIHDKVAEFKGDAPAHLDSLGELGSTILSNNDALTNTMLGQLSLKKDAAEAFDGLDQKADANTTLTYTTNNEFDRPSVTLKVKQVDANFLYGDGSELTGMTDPNELIYLQNAIDQLYNEITLIDGQLGEMFANQFVQFNRAKHFPEAYSRSGPDVLDQTGIFAQTESGKQFRTLTVLNTNDPSNPSYQTRMHFPELRAQPNLHPNQLFVQSEPVGSNWTRGVTFPDNTFRNMILQRGTSESENRFLPALTARHQNDPYTMAFQKTWNFDALTTVSGMEAGLRQTEFIQGNSANGVGDFDGTRSVLSAWESTTSVPDLKEQMLFVDTKLNNWRPAVHSPVNIEIYDREILSPPSPSPTSSSVFGESIDATNDYYVVGEPGWSSQRGQICIFDTATSQHLHTITNPDSVAGDYFGEEVQCDGDYIAVSAYLSDSVTQQAGKIFIYHMPDKALEPTLVRTIAPADMSSDTRLGWNMRLHGTTLVATMFGLKVEETTGVGQVRLYDVTTGNEIRRYESPVILSNNSFGQAVAIDDNYIAISYKEGTGKVAIYDNTSGELLHTLESRYSNDGTQDFGLSLALGNGRLAIGAPRTDGYYVDEGKVEVYNIATGEFLYGLDNPRDYWVEETLNNQMTQANDKFGWKVAMSDKLLLVSSPWASQGTNADYKDQGFVYAYNAENGQFLRKFDENAYYNSTSDMLGYGGLAVIDGPDNKNGRIFIGSPLEDIHGGNAGIVYYYTFSIFTLNTPRTGILQRFGDENRTIRRFPALSASHQNDPYSMVFQNSRYFPPVTTAGNSVLDVQILIQGNAVNGVGDGTSYAQLSKWTDGTTVSGADVLGQTILIQGNATNGTGSFAENDFAVLGNWKLTETVDGQNITRGYGIQGGDRVEATDNSWTLNSTLSGPVVLDNTVIIKGNETLGTGDPSSYAQLSLWDTTASYQTPIESIFSPSPEAGVWFNGVYSDRSVLRFESNMGTTVSGPDVLDQTIIISQNSMQFAPVTTTSGAEVLDQTIFIQGNADSGVGDLTGSNYSVVDNWFKHRASSQYGERSGVFLSSNITGGDLEIYGVHYGYSAQDNWSYTTENGWVGRGTSERIKKFEQPGHPDDVSTTWTSYIGRRAPVPQFVGVYTQSSNDPTVLLTANFAWTQTDGTRTNLPKWVGVTTIENNDEQKLFIQTLDGKHIQSYADVMVGTDWQKWAGVTTQSGNVAA